MPELTELSIEELIEHAIEVTALSPDADITYVYREINNRISDAFRDGYISGQTSPDTVQTSELLKAKSYLEGFKHGQRQGHEEAYVAGYQNGYSDAEEEINA